MRRPTGGARRGSLLVTLPVLALLACGGGGPPGATGAPSPRSSAATASAVGPCASVTRTSDLATVPAPCQAVWRPYGVTKVPPADLLASVPRAPHVVNHTAGRVDDATAQRYGQDSNNDSRWVQWAEANGQLTLLYALNGPAVINGKVKEALAAGATVSDPECDLYPKTLELWPIDQSGAGYFAREAVPTQAQLVLVGQLGATGCSVLARYSDGRQVDLVDSPPLKVFGPGYERRNATLGSVWFTDSGGHCGDGSGPPVDWCAP